MKLFLQVFITLILFFSVSFADQYKEVRKISLKKDQQKKILVKYENKEKLFTFRWTLYVNGGLVVLRSYDKQVGQNVLELNHKNQSFRVALKPRGSSNYNVPYLLVKFKEFDYEKHEAIFELYNFNNKVQVTLEDLKNS
ncbi:hypothetical protein [Sulfurimonas marina]|uniref:Uncharacterized protein n=1 Tax=Sulfurimonas marina TaxID=2590551 RepID=A0A7M1AWI0_9BACT|nr:hypothetical protein [Sulfurimonas marina]QOP40948.1 hypothetical protein FJR03_04005 [Sulfurimonas marina]